MGHRNTPCGSRHTVRFTFSLCRQKKEELGEQNQKFTSICATFGEKSSFRLLSIGIEAN